MGNPSDPAGMLANLNAPPSGTQEQSVQDIGNTFQAQLPQLPSGTEPARGGRIKQLLSNFFQGAGDAMTHAAGLPTQNDLERQRFNQQIQLSNAQSLAGIRQAQLAEYAPVPLMDLDGKPIVDPSTGQMVHLPANVARGFYTAMQNQQGRAQVAQIQNQGRATIEGMKETSPLAQTQIQSIQDKAALGQQSLQLKKDQLQATIQGRNAGLDLKRQQMANNLTKPTSAMQTMGQTAATIIPHIQEMRDLIEQADAKGLIGPSSGRVYSDFLAGKVGSTGDVGNDQLLGRLRSMDSLVKTAMLRTHFGARGGQQMYDKFSQMLNTGKQSKALLNGTLDTFESFAKGYAQAGGVNPNPSGNGTSGVTRFTDGGRVYNIPAGMEKDFLRDHPNASR